MNKLLAIASGLVMTMAVGAAQAADSLTAEQLDTIIAGNSTVATATSNTALLGGAVSASGSPCTTCTAATGTGPISTVNNGTNANGIGSVSAAR